MKKIRSRNISGENGQEIHTSEIYLAIGKLLSWSHLDKNKIKHGQGMIQGCIEKLKVANFTG